VVTENVPIPRSGTLRPKKRGVGYSQVLEGGTQRRGGVITKNHRSEGGGVCPVNVPGQLSLAGVKPGMESWLLKICFLLQPSYEVVKTGLKRKWERSSRKIVHFNGEMIEGDTFRRAEYGKGEWILRIWDSH